MYRYAHESWSWSHQSRREEYFVAVKIACVAIYEWLRAKFVARRMKIRDKGLAISYESVYVHGARDLVDDQLNPNPFCSAMIRVGREASGTCLWCWRCETVVAHLGGGPSSVSDWLQIGGLGK